MAQQRKSFVETFTKSNGNTMNPFGLSSLATSQAYQTPTGNESSTVPELVKPDPVSQDTLVERYKSNQALSMLGYVEEYLDDAIACISRKTKPKPFDLVLSSKTDAELFEKLTSKLIEYQCAKKPICTDENYKVKITSSISHETHLKVRLFGPADAFTRAAVIPGKVYLFKIECPTIFDFNPVKNPMFYDQADRIIGVNWFITQIIQ